MKFLLLYLVKHVITMLLLLIILSVNETEHKTAILANNLRGKIHTTITEDLYRTWYVRHEASVTMSTDHERRRGRHKST